MQHYESIWRKRYLLPCWIFQILGSIVFVVIASLLLVAAEYVREHQRSDSAGFQYSYWGYNSSELIDYARITGAVVLALSVGTILFDIIEIILYARRRLNPIVLLSFACITTLVWGAYFVIALMGAAAGSPSILDILISLVLMATSMAQLIIGAVFTHRVRKGLFLKRKSYNKNASVESGYVR